MALKDWMHKVGFTGGVLTFGIFFSSCSALLPPIPTLIPTIIPQKLSLGPTPTPYGVELSGVKPTPNPTTQPGPKSAPASAYAGTEYTSQRWHISLRVPQGWQPQGEDSFKGNDGFFELESLGVFSDENALARLCELEANLHKERYGDRPLLESSVLNGFDACFILESANQNIGADSAVMLRSRQGPDGDQYLLLRADSSHLEKLAATLAFPQGRMRATSTLQPLPLGTPAGSYPTPELVSTVVGDLTLKEYAVVSAAVDTPGHLEFNQRIPQEIFTNRERQAGWNSDGAVKSGNLALKRFGYSLEKSLTAVSQKETFDLVQRGVTIIKLAKFFPLSVTKSGNDFVMGVEDDKGQTRLMRAGGLVKWDLSQHGGAYPVFVANDLVELDTTLDNPERVFVRKAGQIVFEYGILPMMVKNPIEGLWSWDEHWLLGVNGVLIEDGNLLNDKMGLEQVFNWQLLGGKPFYFFVQDGKTGLSYEDKVLPVQYDTIYHDKCCEAAAFNPGGSPGLIWFYALKKGAWVYSELGK